jgi:hypothetical protein
MPFKRGIWKYPEKGDLCRIKAAEEEYKKEVLRKNEDEEIAKPNRHRSFFWHSKRGQRLRRRHAMFLTGWRKQCYSFTNSENLGHKQVSQRFT